MQNFIINEIERKEQYRVEISNRFATLENLMMWRLTELGKHFERISKFLSLYYYELKQHKSWFDDGYSELLYQGKQTKLQRSQDPR
jgi:hypothetical protein